MCTCNSNCVSMNVPIGNVWNKDFKIRTKGETDYQDLTGRAFAFKLFALNGTLLKTVTATTDELNDKFNIKLNAAFWNNIRKGDYEGRIDEVYSATESNTIRSFAFKVV